MGMQNKGCLMALFTVSAWRKHFVLLYLKKIEGLDLPFFASSFVMLEIKD